MFDARAARALQPGNHIVVEGAPGLRLQASQTTRAWVFRYRSPVDGRMRQMRLGRWPAMPLAAALAAWQTAKAARDAGADPAAERRQTRHASVARRKETAYTVRKACNDYLADYASHVTPKTYAEAARILALDLAELADRPAASIDRAAAFDLIHSRRHRPVQAARLRQLLGAVWDRALDAGRLDADVPNWWRLILRGRLPSQGKIVAGKHQGPDKRVLSEAELQRLLPWLPNFSRDIEDALTLTLWTGCRGGEVVAMERAELAQADGVLWWTIPRRKLKMRRLPLLTDLRVPLVGRAEQVVRRRQAASAGRWLFPSRGGAGSGHIEQKVLGVAVWTHMPACELRPEWVRPRLPVQAWAPHDLRRTARTILAAMGCPDAVAEAILGHHPPGVQGTYNRHGYDAERLVWLSRLADRLEQLSDQAQAPNR